MFIEVGEKSGDLIFFHKKNVRNDSRILLEWHMEEW